MYDTLIFVILTKLIRNITRIKTHSIVLFPSQDFSSNIFEEKKNMVLTPVKK